MTRYALTAVLACLFLAVPALLSGCSQEKHTVTEIKRAFALRAIAGEVQIGSSGRLAAEDADRTTFDLLDVRFDIGGAREQDMMMHAERAEIIVDPKADTMRIRFHNVTSVAVGGQIAQEPVLVTEPWTLSVNVVAD